MKSASSWKPYIVSNSQIPQRVQNLIIRNYFEKNDKEFTLSSTELNHTNNIILRSLINDIKTTDAIVFYNLDVLLDMNASTKNSLLDIVNNNCHIHFAYEEIVIKNKEDIDGLTEILTINKLTKPSLGSEVVLITKVHESTTRNYQERVTDHDKIECSKIASQFGKEYWDGDRKHGYGGYSYDGRWAPVAKRFIDHYQLNNKSKVLDVGCGKGYLLYEIKKLLPDIEVSGVDISDYAIENAHPEVKEYIYKSDATAIQAKSDYFDLVISNATLHNLPLPELEIALNEIERVKKKDSWICVEAYTNIEEKVNLMYWQLTCETLMSKKSWLWLFEKVGYRGDYEFMYFK